MLLSIISTKSIINKIQSMINDFSEGCLSCGICEGWTVEATTSSAGILFIETDIEKHLSAVKYIIKAVSREHPDINITLDVDNRGNMCFFKSSTSTYLAREGQIHKVLTSSIT